MGFIIVDWMLNINSAILVFIVLVLIMANIIASMLITSNGEMRNVAKSNKVHIDVFVKYDKKIEEINRLRHRTCDSIAQQELTRTQIKILNKEAENLAMVYNWIDKSNKLEVPKYD